MALDDVYFGNTDGGKHGYNPENVKALKESIQTAYENCCDGIVETIHDEIVVPISTAWYAPEACKFFGSDETGGILGTGLGAKKADAESLKVVVEKTGDTIFECFDAFRKDIESAGNNWYNNTSGESAGEGEEGAGNITLAALSKKEMKLTVSEIEASDSEGNVVLDSAGVSAVSQKLTQVQENIKTKMTAEKEKLDAATSFIGGGQATAIQNCFGRLLEAIAKIFDWLTEGEDSLQKAFDGAMKKYSDVATNIASVYNNATFDKPGGEAGSN
ncbi:MAG: hypothetical protein IIZ67_01840 [Bacilli bacterium]|nr:hypothetical protein [Bacilli bacterium]